MSASIYAAMRERFCAPEHALFFEVANGTGSNIRRYADAVAMNLFPSRGLTLSGFEIKVTRHDWQRELKNPHKAEEGIFRYCDYWWVVAPADIVKKDELPATWGLLELHDKRGLRQAVAAPRLKPQDITRPFIAALLRRASEADNALVEAAVADREQKRLEAFNARVDERVKALTRELQQKIDSIEGIERQLGVSLTDFHAHDGYGRLLRAMDASGVAKQWSNLRHLAQNLASMAETLNTHIAEFDALAPDVAPPPKAAA